MPRIAMMILIPLVLSACADTGLRNLQNNNPGPDEFLIEPVKPLEAPDSYNTLPAPMPGQANLADRSAINEGIAAFGGRPQAQQGGVLAADAALVQHAGRLGVAPDIRADLAETDAAFRQRKGRFTQIRLVPVDRYAQAYRRQALDADAEAARWRRAGARTPSYPPPRRPSFQ